MLHLTLISPKGPLYRHKGGIFGQGLRYKPLTLPTLAALIPADVPCRLTCLDEGIQDVVLETLQADLVGMTVITGSAPRAYEMANVLRARGIKVVLGGPHVTLAPEDAAPHADAIVVGYAEQTWPQLLRDFQAGQMKARYDQSASFTLADSPLPMRKVLPRHRYLTDSVFEATRGCVHACEFCVVPAAWGRKPWQKPVAHVVEDVRKNGGRNLIFIDLNIIADRPYALELFHALAPLNKRWFGLATTTLCDDAELLEACAKSGCRGLLMGLESVDPAVLKKMGKGFNRPDRYAQVVERLHAKNIALQGCFVFGNDGESEATFELTVKFAVDAGVDLPRFAISTPFPGTALYKRLEKEGRLLHKDWSKYDGQHCVFQPSNMSPLELERGTERAWKQAYSWKGIASRLRQTAAPWPIALITNFTYRRYAHNLDKFYTCDWGLATPMLPKALRGSPVSITVGGEVVA